jgi:hypothetical protein
VFANFLILTTCLFCFLRSAPYPPDPSSTPRSASVSRAAHRRLSSLPSSSSKRRSQPPHLDWHLFDGPCGVCKLSYFNILPFCFLRSAHYPPNPSSTTRSSSASRAAYSSPRHAFVLSSLYFLKKEKPTAASRLTLVDGACGVCKLSYFNNVNFINIQI